MAVTLAELIATPRLDLRIAGSATGDSTAPIQWVAVTELADPTPFLSGGEVLLTTGLRQQTSADQRDFVRMAHQAGVLAIGFGSGLSHPHVPAALIEEADKHALAVFEVPYPTPFMAIGKLVADALSADHYASLERLLKSHQILASALLSDGGLDSMLQKLSSMLGADLELIQYGAPIHRSPSAADDGGSGGEDWEEVAISTGWKDRTTLRIRRPYAADGIVNYAQSLISLELSNQARHRHTQRQIAGQVLDDIIRGNLAGAEAQARLSAAGMTSAGRHAILLVEAAGGDRRSLPTLPLPPSLQDCASAILGERLAVIVTGTVAERARALSSYLDNAGIYASVGQGGSYAQANGLRWSYFEAREALSRGERLNAPERLNLTSLLLASEDVPLNDLAAEALDPLSSFDLKHDAELMRTLESYLQLDGSVAGVASAMGLHRNTVRYRLSQITALTGYDPAVTADRVHLWLAIAVSRLQSPDETAQHTRQDRRRQPSPRRRS
ncbi:PucR family transcriptional regulator [Arthrobacter castelli]|uniref:PucR family transcriptional regulator n=1 Tax=Arthrobacter castelli TaxID=271431 RepID=UPI0003FCA431|nr:PucR family transcriptional regulator [Arthrobacter castelli]